MRFVSKNSLLKFFKGHPSKCYEDTYSPPKSLLEDPRVVAAIGKKETVERLVEMAEDLYVPEINPSQRKTKTFVNYCQRTFNKTYTEALKMAKDLVESRIEDSLPGFEFNFGDLPSCAFSLYPTNGGGIRSYSAGGQLDDADKCFAFSVRAEDGIKPEFRKEVTEYTPECEKPSLSGVIPGIRFVDSP